MIKINYIDQYPAGENVLVAIMPYTGYNQEDSIILNRSAIERGMFWSTEYDKFKSKLQKNKKISGDEKHEKPDVNKIASGPRNSTLYEKLNNKGYVDVNTTVEKDDILICKLIRDNSSESEQNTEVTAETYTNIKPGKVDSVVVTHDSNGYELIKMRTRSLRIPQMGDKFCSRSAQKGTVGIILDNKDMPFTEEGIRPDIIMNPCAFPSRMTIGQLLESLFSIGAAHECTDLDGTPFLKYNMKEIEEMYKKNNLPVDGKYTMYNGITGRKLKERIYMGNIYYMRLKHMVANKVHARFRGNMTALTRQPPEGRARKGGLRFGIMEQNCQVAHGNAQFVKERMLESSDLYSTMVCENCGNYAVRNYDDNEFKCDICGKLTEIVKIIKPYCTKLLQQEEMTIGVHPVMHVENHQ